jgi:integrase
VGEILGHTLKGLGLALGVSGSLESVTAQYIDVRLDRKKAVLDAYHGALGLKKDAGQPEPPSGNPARSHTQKASETAR